MSVKLKPVANFTNILQADNSFAIKLQSQTLLEKFAFVQKRRWKNVGENDTCRHFHQRFTCTKFCRKKITKPNVTREIHFHTKKVRVKCWWNWHLPSVLFTRRFKTGSASTATKLAKIFPFLTLYNGATLMSSPMPDDMLATACLFRFVFIKREFGNCLLWQSL